MNELEETPFLKFLEAGVSKGGFETDDVLCAFLPLMKQVRAAHSAGLVAPLKGIQDLKVTEDGHLSFEPSKASAPERNVAKVEALQSPVSRAMEVVGETRRISDIDAAGMRVSDLGVGKEDQFSKPVFS